MDKLFEKFKNPDRRYAIYQIIHGKTESTESIDLYDKNGFAGIVGNIDYNYDFPNDEASWKRHDFFCGNRLLC